MLDRIQALRIYWALVFIRNNFLLSEKIKERERKSEGSALATIAATATATTHRNGQGGRIIGLVGIQVVAGLASDNQDVLAGRAGWDMNTIISAGVYHEVGQDRLFDDPARPLIKPLQDDMSTGQVGQLDIYSLTPRVNHVHIGRLTTFVGGGELLFMQVRPRTTAEKDFLDAVDVRHIQRGLVLFQFRLTVLERSLFEHETGILVIDLVILGPGRINLHLEGVEVGVVIKQPAAVRKPQGDVQIVRIKPHHPLATLRIQRKHNRAGATHIGRAIVAVDRTLTIIAFRALYPDVQVSDLTGRVKRKAIQGFFVQTDNHPSTAGEIVNLHIGQKQDEFPFGATGRLAEYLNFHIVSTMESEELPGGQEGHGRLYPVGIGRLGGNRGGGLGGQIDGIKHSQAGQHEGNDLLH